ncbi:HSF-type DNA-binding protein [Nitzschia inconspicua]|uniref:HSF-type DNA-binding protein n=1 Tax=Nitzschia inconspicua TaxID=303405 RepID=A0A9K3LL26_9STRA|nr:HSF-type DNA-binding protein [Nitzschia inconspicua]KAG7364087.1 HSF-type DNA-binding protein [Nitzschia inconspicua]
MVLNKALEFPARLHDLLDNAEEQGYDDIISWHGDGFKIHDTDKLLPILNLRFRITRLKSFLRQLQAWDFHRVHCGPDKGLCTHKLFQRGNRILSTGMKRKYSSSSKEKVTIAANKTSTNTDVLRTVEASSVNVTPPQQLVSPTGLETSATIEMALLLTRERLLLNHRAAEMRLIEASSSFLNRCSGFVGTSNDSLKTNDRTSPFQVDHTNSPITSPIVRALVQSSYSAQNMPEFFPHVANLTHAPITQLFWYPMHPTPPRWAP